MSQRQQRNRGVTITRKGREALLAAGQKEIPWTRAPEAVRCKASLSTIGLPSQCDRAAGHEGLHQYMSVAGSIVSFSYVERRGGTTRDLTMPEVTQQ